MRDNAYRKLYALKRSEGCKNFAYIVLKQQLCLWVIRAALSYVSFRIFLLLNFSNRVGVNFSIDLRKILFLAEFDLSDHKKLSYENLQ